MRNLPAFPFGGWGGRMRWRRSHLASDAAGFITGETISADGGLLDVLPMAMARPRGRCACSEHSSHPGT